VTGTGNVKRRKGEGLRVRLAVAVAGVAPRRCGVHGNDPFDCLNRYTAERFRRSSGMKRNSLILEL
jgi:hypothetical protein